MLPVYPFVGLLVKTSVRDFFTNRQPCYNAPPTCISVNCVEILLNVIRSNVHKTVVSYKTVQLFCSDVVVQNINVISSPTCKVLCFKKHHRVSPIKCFVLETSPYAVTTSTKLPSLPSSSILSPSLSSLPSHLQFQHHHHHHYHHHHYH